MATFSVDITDIIFAGGRTGSKVVTISNAPSGGIGISNTGYGTHFRVVVKEENVSYSIETKATNSTSQPYDSKIRFYNKEDSNDYVEISVWQYNVTTYFDLYADNLKSTSSSGGYSWDFGNQQGSADLFIDARSGYEGKATVTEGTDWLSAVKENPTDTGFYHYTINYTSNTNAETRVGHIQCTASGSGNINTIIVNQAGGAPAASLSISPTSNSVSKASGAVNITVTTTDISDVSYSISDSWITYSSKSGDVYTFNYTENTTTSQRQGTITFSGGGISQTFTLTQEGISSDAISVDKEIVCIPNGGGGGFNVTITYNGNVTVSKPSWLLSSTTSMTVNGTYKYSFSANARNEDGGKEPMRTDSLVFIGDNGTRAEVLICQGGYTYGKVPVIYPTKLNEFSADGGSQYLVVDYYKTLTISKGNNWITVKKDESDDNDYSPSVYVVTAFRNGGPRRVSTFTLQGETGSYKIVDVSQAAGSSASSISVSPSSLSFGADASYADISLTYGGTYYNTDAAEVHTWVTVNISDTETGKAAGTVSVASNTTTESRSGNVYFSDELGASIALPIEQAGISFALSANPSTLNIPASGGSVTTAVTYEGTLSAASLPSWLSETHTDTDANHRTYTVTAASNGPTQERTFNWKLNDDYNNMYVFISQAAAEVPSMVISPTSSSVGSSAGTVDITVRSTNISDISYSISDSWIAYSSKSGSIYTFNYTENTTTSQRQGTITFSGGGISQTFTLTQEGQGGSNPLSVSPTELNFTASGDTKSVTVSGGTGTIAVNTGSFPSWLSITSVGNGVYNITASENSGVSRSFDVWFTDEASTTVIVNVSQDASSVKLTVSPSSKSFGSAGGSQVFRVTYNTRINYNTLPSWLSITSSTTTGSTIEYTMTASENTDTSSRNFNWVLTDELTSVTVPISQSGASGPGPEPVEEGSLKVYPEKLRYYSDGGRILVSFTNRPEEGLGYSITYTDGSGWLSIEGVTPNMYVSATANDGIRRRAEIKFYDLSDNTNYVIVPVIQGSVGGYSSIWMDDLYYPENRDASGNYFYKVVNQDTGQIYFIGISSKPLSWTGNIGGIDVPRLVDNYIKSDFVQQNTGEDWVDMHSGYCTVDIYNMAATDSVVDATFKYWNDWSRFEKKYDYTRSLNDPINGKGCNNMIIPFCVYYDDEATFTIVDTAKNGNINTYTLSSPSSPFVMRYNSYYDIKKVEYKQDDDVLFSYDMNHCGPGAFIYRNRFGGWDSFLIEGNISKTDNYTKQNYRIKGEYNQEYVINTLKYIDEKRTDSIDIDTTYEASTGWLTDEESERLVFHLLSSPIVYFQNLHKENQLYDTDSNLDIIPVRITASSSEYKKFRNGRRLVNYLITFEKCNIEKVRQ